VDPLAGVNCVPNVRGVVQEMWWLDGLRIMGSCKVRYLGSRQSCLARVATLSRDA
jgi:hypothetical protein